MLSRRNIRIKVMQVLYAMNRDSQLTYQHALVRYRQNIDWSYQLFLFNLLQLLDTAAYAVKDEDSKSDKLLPSDYDQLFTAKLYHNPLTQSLATNEIFQKTCKKYKLPARLDADTARNLYNSFAKTEEYLKYIRKEETGEAEHRDILHQLYKHCVNSELFVDRVEDHYPSWIDDKSLVVGSVKKVLKALPISGNFLSDYEPNAETVTDFGETLLTKVCEEDEELLKIIEPNLKNWDVERVAVIDMILLKMALCELIYFKTIPTKVSLNEFVEISKLYSTDKSKDFINGILDRLMKELERSGRINKEGRGLKD